ncbi:MAG: sigma-70 family RNA polymerase sigma factor [Blastocatellia bacterium]|nr:sigma-70 family RNA polymerase sigma factor [Blastocatellia bacterium]
MIEPTSDEALLNRAITGDETAFLTLYQRHRDVVYGFAYRFTNSVETAEDITHDCFMGLLKNPNHFDPSRASLSTYLCGAARNQAHKLLRILDQPGETETDFEAEALRTDRNPLQALVEAELTQAVQTAISDLPPLQREAIILFEYEEMPLAEIAKVSGTDVGTIKSRLKRARERLKRLFTGYF